MYSEHTPEQIGAPLELVTSEVTARSFRVSWSPAPGNVEKYRVVYYLAQGGEPQEVNTAFLRGTQCHLLWRKSVFHRVKLGKAEGVK